MFTLQAKASQFFLNPVLVPRVLPIALALALLAVGAGLGMASVFAWIHQAWWSFAGVGVYSHGYIVLGMAIWMGWTNWRRDPPAGLAPNWWVLAPLFGLVVLLAGMELLYIDSSRALLVPLLLLSVIGLVFGLGAGWRLALPVLFLYFGLLPFWILNPLLQTMATRVTGWLLELVNVPVYIEGHSIQVTAGNFEVIAACSGLSFLLSGLALAVFYGLMYLRLWRNRLLVAAVAVGAAVVSNWFRVWSVVLIGDLTEMQHYLVDEHYLYGWMLFMVSMAPVLFLAERLSIGEFASRRPAKRGWARAVTATRSRRTRGLSPTVVVAATVAALLLSLPRLFMAGAGAGEIGDSATGPLSLPERLGVVARVAADPDWQPVFAGAQESRASYPWVDGGVEGIVHVYRAVYTHQGRGRHLFLGSNTLTGNRDEVGSVAGSGVLLNSDSAEQSAELMPELMVVEYQRRMAGAGRDYLIWGWYEVAGQPVTSRLQAKLAELQAPAGRSDGVALALAVECDLLNCENARRLLPGFLEALLPALHEESGSSGNASNSENSGGRL